MEIHSLQKIVHTSKKRLGRGHGSGRGKTAGRGTKGQNARGSMPLHFEGGQLSIVRKLPFLRGKGRNKSRYKKPVIVAVKRLEVIPEKTTVSIDILVKTGLIPEGTTAVKILAGGGALSRAYTVSVPCSSGAKTIIEKAGGSVVS